MDLFQKKQAKNSVIVQTVEAGSSIGLLAFVKTVVLIYKLEEVESGV
jgi:hypothetical protein